jgi:hypothetical protein
MTALKKYEFHCIFIYWKEKIENEEMLKKRVFPNIS